jgi:peptidoglycan L-alanyl-D-glutamate endopeptidase CwlK
MIDKSSLDKIEKLHPFIKEEVKKLVDTINTSVLTGNAKVRIAQGLRTFAEQDILYKQRPKVTNAKGGDSIHNYGLAIDIVLVIDGKTASWDVKKDFDKDAQSDWMEVVQVFKKAGYSWGGDWRTFKDMPHFEKTNKLTLQQIKTKFANKDFITGTNYIKL